MVKRGSSSPSSPWAHRPTGIRVIAFHFQLRRTLGFTRGVLGGVTALSSAIRNLSEIRESHFAGKEPMVQALEFEMTGPKARYLPLGEGSKVRICQTGLMRSLE